MSVATPSIAIKEAVLELVAAHRATSPDEIRPEMTFKDPGIGGDDAVELHEALCERFSIDPKKIDLGR